MKNNKKGTKSNAQSSPPSQKNEKGSEPVHKKEGFKRNESSRSE